MIKHTTYEVTLTTHSGGVYCDWFATRPTVHDLKAGLALAIEELQAQATEESNAPDETERFEDDLNRLDDIEQLISVIKPIALECAIKDGKESIVVAGTPIGEIRVNQRIVLFRDDFHF